MLDGDGEDDEDDERLLNEEREDEGDKLGSPLNGEGEYEGDRLESEESEDKLLCEAEDA